MAGSWVDPEGLPLAEVKNLLVTLTKALRAVQLYDERNPVYQRFVSGLASAFRDLWDGMDRLSLAVEEDALLVHGEEVYRNDSRSESLAFLLHKDGIREITFLPGLEDAELEAFLRVLRRARSAGPQGDDLVTILWDADLQYVRYAYVDLLAEGVDLPGRDPDLTLSLAPILEGELQAPAEPEGEEGEEGEDQAGGEAGPPLQSSISREDFNPTLYALDRAEQEELQRELEREMSRPLREDVLAALFDRLEEPEHPSRQSEILSILSTLLPNLLSQGLLRRAGEVLQELQVVRSRPEVFDGVREAEADRILDELSTPEALGELVRALEEKAITPTALELGSFLRHLKSGALGPLLHAADVMEDRTLKPVLMDAVRGIAETNPALVVEFLADERPTVNRGAARMAGRLRLAEAAPGLGRLLRHPDPTVRLAALEGAVNLRSSAVTGMLQEALGDEDREVRMGAARGLAELRFKPSATALREILKGKALRSADLSEKIAFFESYGVLEDPGAVPLLSGMLNGRNLLGRREHPEIRACAALALGKVGTREALAAMERARDDGDPVVRSAVSRAMRREEQ
jgi:HEAT repeat protein